MFAHFFQILVFIAKLGDIIIEFHALHHLSSVSSLPFHLDICIAGNAVVWWCFQLSRGNTTSKLQHIFNSITHSFSGNTFHSTNLCQTIDLYLFNCVARWNVFNTLSITCLKLGINRRRLEWGDVSWDWVSRWASDWNDLLPLFHHSYPLW